MRADGEAVLEEEEQFGVRSQGGYLADLNTERAEHRGQPGNEEIQMAGIWLFDGDGAIEHVGWYPSGAGLPPA